MREIIQKIYEFKELNKEVQKRVIQKYKDDNTFWDDSMFQEYMISLWTELLEKNKIKEHLNTHLHYSLSYSQGDGVCFVGGYHWKEYYVKLTHYGHYYHTNSVSFEIEDNEGNDVQEDIYDEFKNIFENICGELEEKGYDYIEKSNEDTYIIDEIQNNEYEFYEDGKRCNHC